MVERRWAREVDGWRIRNDGDDDDDDDDFDDDDDDDFDVDDDDDDDDDKRDRARRETVELASGRTLRIFTSDENRLSPRALHTTYHPTGGVAQHPLRGFSLLTILRRNQRENPRHPSTLAHPLSCHPSPSVSPWRRRRSRSRSPTSTFTSFSASNLAATHPLRAPFATLSASLTHRLPAVACIYPDVYLPIYLDALGVRPKTSFHFSAWINANGASKRAPSSRDHSDANPFLSVL